AKHTESGFPYAPDRHSTHDPATGRVHNDPRWDGRPYVVRGFNDRDGRPTLTFAAPDGAGAAHEASGPDKLEAAWPDAAIWPREFQRPGMFLRKGHIANWDYYPEYAEGDMWDLKTLDLWVQRA